MNVESVELVGFHVLVGFQPGHDVHGVMGDAEFHRADDFALGIAQFRAESGVAGIRRETEQQHTRGRGDNRCGASASAFLNMRTSFSTRLGLCFYELRQMARGLLGKWDIPVRGIQVR